MNFTPKTKEELKKLCSFVNSLFQSKKNVKSIDVVLTKDQINGLLVLASLLYSADNHLNETLSDEQNNKTTPYSTYSKEMAFTVNGLDINELYDLFSHLSWNDNFITLLEAFPNLSSFISNSEKGNSEIFCIFKLNKEVEKAKRKEITLNNKTLTLLTGFYIYLDYLHEIWSDEKLVNDNYILIKKAIS